MGVNVRQVIQEREPTACAIISKDAGMSQRLNVLYRNTAEEFARQVTAVLSNQVHCIVLYGSVARKQARKASDIDVLVVGTTADLRDRILDMAYAVMESSRFETFMSIVYMSQQEFRLLARFGSLFIRNVLDQGVALHDDGTFSRVRQEVRASVGRDVTGSQRPA